MKRIAILIALGAAVLSLNSCGLPGALVRTASNAVQGAGNLVNSAGLPASTFLLNVAP